MIHVLHAEDDPEFAKIIRTLFESQAPGSTVTHVTTGAACLERMRQGGVDVLLLDLMLPDTDGLQVLGELAARADETPVILISGFGQTELAVKALRAGAADCLDKTSPQCLRVVEIAQRLVDRGGGGAPQGKRAAEPARVHRVVLIENAAPARSEIGDFFAAGAFAIGLSAMEWPASPPSHPPDADALVIGSAPDGSSPLDLLRALRSHSPDVPVIMLGAPGDSEATVAAFRLGAQDYIFVRPGYLGELVFSIRNVVNRAELTRRNVRLSRELAAVNRSLEAQVSVRTRELEALSSRLIRIREEERRTIARELHDQIGQTLTGLKLQLEAASRQAPESVRARLSEALGLATELLSRTRDMTLQLRPPVLDDLGLQAAIEWHIKLLRRQTGISVECECSLPAARLSGELEITLFRIVQESLTNVARHSGAASAQLTVTSDDSQIILEISDRGSGFDPARLKAGAGSLGLAGLAERARLAGGKLEVFSRESQGTRIHASFPLRPPTPP